VGDGGVRTGASCESRGQIDGARVCPRAWLASGCIYVWPTVVLSFWLVSFSNLIVWTVFNTASYSYRLFNHFLSLLEQ
jgi:hypothetical protein